jgi:hypothetical protein
LSRSSAASSIVTIRSESEGRLAGARTAGDEDVQLGPDAAVEEPDDLRRDSPQPHELVHVEPLPAELADRDERARERERREDRVHAAAVGKPGVDHRRRLVDAAANLGHHLVDDPAQVGLVLEADGRLVEAPLALDPDVEGAVDHDLRHAVICEQPLERPVPEDVVGDFGRDAVAIVAGNSRLSREVRPNVAHHALPERLGVDVHVEELRPEVPDHSEVDAVLQLRERIVPRCGGNRGGGQQSLVQFHQCLLRASRNRPLDDAGCSAAGTKL